MSISIQFLGAAGCVTGSQFLVSVGDRRVLVDCGMFQGSPLEIERNQMPFAFEAAALDAVILTHAHLDHCGRLPALVKAGFTGPIHATHATADLADIVLRDSAKLQVEFTTRWNQRQARKAERAARPRPRPIRRRSLRKSTTCRSPSDCAVRGRKGRPKPGRRSTTSTTSRSRCSSSAGPTTTPRSP